MVATVTAPRARYRIWLAVCRAFLRLPLSDVALHVLAVLTVLSGAFFGWPERVLGMEICDHAEICAQCAQIHTSTYACVRTPVLWCLDCDAWRTTTKHGHCPLGARHRLHPNMRVTRVRFAWREGTDLRGRRIAQVDGVTRRRTIFRGGSEWNQ